MADAPDVQTCVGRYTNFRDLTDEYKIDFHRRRLTAMAKHIHPGELVLDVGCNGGYMVEYLPEDCEVHGIDPSESAVRLARMRLASARVGSAESLPFAYKSFDVVVLGYIVERVFDPQAVIAEARRVARRVIVGDTPHEDGPWGTAHVQGHAYDVRCYDRASLQQLIAPNGERCAIQTVSWGSGPVMYSFQVEV